MVLDDQTKLFGRVQDYLRGLAHRRYVASPVPPFTLFSPPTTAPPESIFAVPNEPSAAERPMSLIALRNLCRRQGHDCRIDYVEGFVPVLTSVLDDAGFAEEQRTHVLICRPADYWPAAAVPGLTVATLTSTAALAEVKEFLNTLEQGFHPGTALVSDTEASDFRRELTGTQALIARLDGLAVGVGLLAPPIGQLAGLFGVATLPAFRRRGVAAVLTARAVQVAFELGVEGVLVDTGDAEAERVYERIGFRRVTDRCLYRSQ